MHGVLSEGAQLNSKTFLFRFLFLLDLEVQLPLKAGHLRTASETPFKCCLAGGPMMAKH